MPLRSGAAEIELAIDRGRIIAGRRSSGIAEVELELKRGSPSELYRLARIFEHRTRAELYLASKSERGYALTQGGGSPVRFAEPVTLQHDTPAIDAFRIIARSTMRHFADNADAVRAKDPEGVHQMRVGLRRTRAAISVFAETLPCARTERIKLELKWLTNELAPARELDVFMRKKVGPATCSSVSTRGARAVKKEFAARRRQAFTRAGAALTSSRYRRLLIDVVEWLETELPSALLPIFQTSASPQRQPGRKRRGIPFWHSQEMSCTTGSRKYARTENASTRCPLASDISCVSRSKSFDTRSSFSKASMRPGVSEGGWRGSPSALRVCRTH